MVVFLKGIIHGIKSLRRFRHCWRILFLILSQKLGKDGQKSEIVGVCQRWRYEIRGKSNCVRATWSNEERQRTCQKCSKIEFGGQWDRMHAPLEICEDNDDDDSWKCYRSNESGSIKGLSLSLISYGHQTIKVGRDIQTTIKPICVCCVAKIVDHFR